MPPDIKITAELRDSRPLANPVGKSPGRFATKRESALMPLSPGNIFATNPLQSPGVYPPGLAADTRITFHQIPE